jgi:hypothetical protein
MKLSDHTVYWFFPFQFQVASDGMVTEIPPLKLHHLRLSKWAADSVAKKADSDDRDESAWREQTLPLKSDLLPHVERLLGGQQANGPESQGLALTPLALSEKAMATIGNSKHNFGLGLSPSALRRAGLGQSSESNNGKGKADAAASRSILPFKLESARLFRFGTGTGLLVIEVAYAKPEREDGKSYTCTDDCMPSVLLEGNHTLGHPSRGGEFFWRASYAQGGKAEGYVANEALSLSSVAKTLLQGIPGFKEAAGFSRLYSYTAAIVAVEPAESLTDYACRVARRYTADYAINPADFSPFSPFNDIVHVAEYEGAASLVNECGHVEYLQQFMENSVRPTLLPMLLLVQHEHNFLLNLVDASSTGYLAEKDEEKRAEFLRKQREHYVDYRLNYRFVHAARLSPQNGVYSLCRKALRVDEIAAGLDADLENMAAIELEKHRVRVKNESRKINTLIAGVALGLFAKEVLEPFKNKMTMNMYEWQIEVFKKGTDLPALEKIAHEVSSWELISVLVFLVFFGIGAAFFWFKGTKIVGSSE